MALTQAYIERMRQVVATQLPEMLPLYNTIAGETCFAREWLAQELASLERGAHILEVGGGTFLLSCLLAEEGYKITSIEPVGSGFGEFAELAKLILAHATSSPMIVACRAEDFTSPELFDFAFSVNVMEHVDDVDAVIQHVTDTLKAGAHYRFFCPNYLFPYEPHFNIPLIVNKDITQFLLHQRIHGHPMKDPVGAWHSLNWITVPQVRHAARLHGLAAEFRRDLFSAQLSRATSDAGFAARRGGMMTRFIRVFMALRLHRLIEKLPAITLPTMDVILTRSPA